VLGLVLLAWAAMAVLQLLLFLRPTPYGTPYVQLTRRYLPFAIAWDLWAAVIPALPFLAFWTWRWNEAPSRAGSRRSHYVLLALLVLTAFLDHADHEMMRFMGLHLSWSVIRTYGNVAVWPEDMYALFARDPGGPWLTFLIAAVLVPGMVWAGRRLIRDGASVRWPAGWRPAAGLVVALVAAPALTLLLGKASNRWRRAQPAVFGVVRESLRVRRAGAPPANYGASVRDYQTGWLAGQRAGDWRFIDSAFPLVRAPTAPAPAGEAPWNVIFLQLETFRGWDTGFLRPDRSFTPTPFLDSIANHPHNAAWTRHLSFGPETVNGLFAGHCSVKPHRHWSPTAMFLGTRFVCLPDMVRRHGWHAAVVTGIDPDWDFQTPWLRAWYDEVSLPPTIELPDRELFRRAAGIARRLGGAGRPFFLTVVSYSNHVPFRSREPSLDLVQSTRPDSAIWNTMHYTDDVIREFVTAMRGEPWFDHTLLVVTGDHGTNLGEHDGNAGQRNGWRESVWVPLIIAGRHPRLPRGHHADVASLLDIAPTVADLLGIRDTVPWMGHSLLDSVPPARHFCGARANASFAERGRWSYVGDPATGDPRLYDALRDPLQRHDLAEAFPDTAAGLAACVREEQRLVDYLLTSNRIWPPPVPHQN